MGEGDEFVWEFGDEEDREEERRDWWEESKIGMGKGVVKEVIVIGVEELDEGEWFFMGRYGVRDEGEVDEG